MIFASFPSPSWSISLLESYSANNLNKTTASLNFMSMTFVAKWDRVKVLSQVQRCTVYHQLLHSILKRLSPFFLFIHIYALYQSFCLFVKFSRFEIGREFSEGDFPPPPTLLSSLVFLIPRPEIWLTYWHFERGREWGEASTTLPLHL